MNEKVLRNTNFSDFFLGYDDIKTNRSTLITNIKKNKILKSLKESDVLILQSEPGIGVTSQLCQILYKNHYNFDNKKTAVILYNNSDVIKNAERVAEELHSSLGIKVGFKLNEIDSEWKNCEIIFFDFNSFLEELKIDSFIEKFRVVVLDNFFCDYFVKDLVLFFLKGVLKKRDNLKLIINTIYRDAIKMEKYFDCEEKQLRINFLDLFRTKSNIKIYYLKNPEKNLIKKSVQIAIQLHVEKSFEKSILIILPSKNEIKSCKNLLLIEKQSQNIHDVFIYEIHKKLKIEAQMKVFEKIPPNCRKIVLVTDLIENSIKIDNVGFIIDLMMIKKKVFNPYANFDEKFFFYVNNYSALKRSFRVDDDGEVYRLITYQYFKKFVFNKLDKNIENQNILESEENNEYNFDLDYGDNQNNIINRKLKQKINLINDENDCDIKSEIKLKSFDMEKLKCYENDYFPNSSYISLPIDLFIKSNLMNIENILDINFLSKINRENFLKCLEILHSLKVINLEGKITEDFKILLNYLIPFNLDIKEIVILKNSFKAEFACGKEMIILISMLKHKRIFKKTKNESLIFKRKKKYGAKEGDLISLINLFHTFLNLPKNLKKQFCEENLLDEKELKNVVIFKNKLEGFFQIANYKIESSIDNVESIQKCFLSGYFMNIAQKSNFEYYKILNSNESFFLHPQSILNFDLPQFVVFEKVFFCEKNKKFFLYNVDKIYVEWVSEVSNDYYINTVKEDIIKKREKEIFRNFDEKLKNDFLQDEHNFKKDLLINRNLETKSEFKEKEEIINGDSQSIIKEEINTTKKKKKIKKKIISILNSDDEI